MLLNSPAPDIKANYERLKALLAAHGKSAVRIIAVSKTRSAAEMNLLYDLGQREFGENRLQEGRQKFSFLNGPVILHHIGPLQKSGVRLIPGCFQYVQGISRMDVLENLARAALRFADGQKDSRFIPIHYLIQVDLTGEESKLGGMREEELFSLPGFVENQALIFSGFMTMGPSDGDPVQTREVFHRLREIRNKLLPAGELSMGMSSDLEIALEEGATMIRPGSMLFGARS
ncbi:MAG: YggS family pyridoxal phosphate-dependent enzyme [Spirochaetales bacterium]|nr:YggS family pyridoxal phosphate-dependent enzyme [Spirochaetales bacterium]